jgi:hypothetical protein
VKEAACAASMVSLIYLALQGREMMAHLILPFMGF